jgi:hypothetical protein
MVTYISLIGADSDTAAAIAAPVLAARFGKLSNSATQRVKTIRNADEIKRTLHYMFRGNIRKRSRTLAEMASQSCDLGTPELIATIKRGKNAKQPCNAILSTHNSTQGQC